MANEPTTAGRKQSARDRLLQAAARRFYADGIAATGIDTITAEAGVAKMSLYNNFASKADLVQAYLQARHQEWSQLYAVRRDRADAAAGGPRERVLAVFDAYLDHAESAHEHGFRGCGQLNAAAELPVGDPARLVVQQHKEDVEAIVRGELEQLTTPQRAAETAEHLSFLLEGSMARAGLEGAPGRILRARSIARSVLDALDRPGGAATDPATDPATGTVPRS
ncbi:TetR/AcrR family transcriptional regulator [Kineococcus indalonis]|uniref:TetR/AcrR family transcriptional regulator n=1 Tax=Kineococcus indalonis TaxID=2696566 RepID=UPI001412E0AB|nr:TetR/AcrR family transcriptional regulator [Kineococcus indalonis]NAZ86105.1 TetR family transcriptional regulator [Kineococcus indalonis]